MPLAGFCNIRQPPARLGLRRRCDDRIGIKKLKALCMTTPQTKKITAPHAWFWLIFFGLLGAYDLYDAWKTQLLPPALTGVAFILFAFCAFSYRGAFKFSPPAGDASKAKPGLVWKVIYSSAIMLIIISYAMKHGWLKV